jgi:hypothetical protein
MDDVADDVRYGIAAGGEGPVGLANCTPQYPHCNLFGFAPKGFQCAPWIASVHSGSELYAAHLMLLALAGCAPVSPPSRSSLRREPREGERGEALRGCLALISDLLPQ